MMELQIAVCEDLEQERFRLGQMIQRYAKEKSLALQLHLFSNGEDLLLSIQQSGFYHILFLDIYMPGLSGIETAERIRSTGCNAAIIFATTSIEHGLESFRVRAADYLTKPFHQADVDRTLDWCLAHMPDSLRRITVYSEGEWQELTLSSILYVEVLGHRSYIHTQKRSIVVSQTLGNLEAVIDSRDFLRCHRSYLINMNHVQSFQKHCFIMSNGTTIPISIANRSRVRNTFCDWNYIRTWEQS